MCSGNFFTKSRPAPAKLLIFLRYTTPAVIAPAVATAAAVPARKFLVLCDLCSASCLQPLQPNATDGLIDKSVIFYLFRYAVTGLMVVKKNYCHFCENNLQMFINLLRAWFLRT